MASKAAPAAAPVQVAAPKETHEIRWLEDGTCVVYWKITCGSIEITGHGTPIHPKDALAWRDRVSEW